jgi:hypothetical protein
MEDFSFKSLALTGVLLGFVVWALTGKSSSDASRSPTESDRQVAKISNKAEYRPEIPADGGRDEEVSNRVDENTSKIIVDTDSAKENAKVVQVTNSEFAKTRQEIATMLAQGEEERAVKVAEEKLEESVKVPNPEIAYVGYLHEFIMQNSEDDEVELDATITAMRGTQDLNVRKFIFEKFQTYSPQLVDRLEKEMGDDELSLE